MLQAVRVLCLAIVSCVRRNKRLNPVTMTPKRGVNQAGGRYLTLDRIAATYYVYISNNRKNRKA